MSKAHGKMQQLFGKLLELQRSTVEVVTEILATKDAEEREDREMSVIPSSSDKGPVHVRVLDLINQRPDKLFSPSFVARKLRVQRNAVHVALHRLKTERHVICVANGLYRAVELKDESR